jgi:thymidylate synthase (FAD)
MKIIKPSAVIIAASTDIEKTIELAGRLCYKSEDNITETSHINFLEKLRGLHHESVLEHGSISVHFICDRGITHELVRHRIASFSQESTRYCNYSKGKFGNEITVIDPSEGLGWDLSTEEGARKKHIWRLACEASEAAYFDMLDSGCRPQEARSVLPNSLKTEIVVTANPREWLHIFKLRAASTAHPQMVEVMRPLQEKFAAGWPHIFGS